MFSSQIHYIYPTKVLTFEVQHPTPSSYPNPSFSMNKIFDCPTLHSHIRCILVTLRGLHTTQKMHMYYEVVPMSSFSVKHDNHGINDLIWDFFPQWLTDSSSNLSHWSYLVHFWSQIQTIVLKQQNWPVLSLRWRVNTWQWSLTYRGRYCIYKS